jgi:hypothetical protein
MKSINHLYSTHNVARVSPRLPKNKGHYSHIGNEHHHNGMNGGVTNGRILM